jgi:hypothetical protein
MLIIMGIEGDEVQAKSIENIFNTIIAQNFPNLKKEIVIQEQEAFRTPNTQDQKRISLYHIIVKILGIQNKEKY